MPDSFSDFPLLSESETPVMPKVNISIKSPKHSKTQITDKMAPEELTSDSSKVLRCRSNLHHAEKIKILLDISIL